MNKTLCGFALLSVTMIGVCRIASASQADEEVAIRRLQTEQANSWNRHDAAGYARLFADDGDLVNVMGWWWQGRAEIESKLSSAFEFVFHESQLTITDTSVRFLSPTIAAAHIRWTMVGARTPPGMPEPRSGIELQILQKRAGHWLIQSFQNTNGVPERPFPTGAPGAAPRTSSE